MRQQLAPALRHSILCLGMGVLLCLAAAPGLAITPVAVPLPAPATPSTALLPGAVTATDLHVVVPSPLLLADAGVATAQQQCQGRPLAEVQFEGCADTRCAEAWILHQCISLTDLHRGEILGHDALENAYKRLMKLTYFRTVRVSCSADASGQGHATFSVTGNDFVRDVVIRGNKVLFEDELRSKLVIRPGDVLNATTPDGLAALQRQRDALEAIYQRSGYDEVHVEVSAETLRPGELRLHIDIDEGSRQRVGRQIVRIFPLPPPTEAEEGAGLSCPRLSERVILDKSEFQSQDVFTRRAANKARTRIRTFLRSLGYGNPRIDISHDAQEEAVVLDVRPGRCNLVRIFVREEAGAGAKSGFALSSDEALRDALPFAESGLYDFDEADRGRSDLMVVMENRGYLFADVQIDYRPVPKELGSQVETAITYYVTTGFISQVRGMSFPGAHHFDASQLLAVMSSKPYDFFDTGGYAQIDQLLGDLDTLRQFYRSAGFYQFRYDIGLPDTPTPTTPSERARSQVGGATVFEYRYPDKGFQIRRLNGENFIYVDIPISEGEQTRLRDVHIEGAGQVRLGHVQRLLGLHKGDVVSYDLLQKALRSVEEHYRNTGYFRMELETRCATRGPDRAEAPCSADMMLAREVDLHVVIREGQRVDVGEVFVAGNFKTNAAVVLRDMPKAGVAFSAEALFEAQRRLRNLGVFSQVAFQYIGEDEKPPRSRLAILVQVAESQSQFADYAIGFQTINGARNDGSSAGQANGGVDALDHLTSGTDRLSTGFGQAVGLTLPNLLMTAEAAYIDRNFLSSAKELRLPVKVGLSFTGFDIKSLRGLWILPSYYDSRLLGSDFGLRIIVPYYRRDYATQAIDEDRTGLFAEVTRRFGKIAIAMATDTGLVRSRTPGSTEFSPGGATCPVDSAGQTPHNCKCPDGSLTCGFVPQFQAIPRLTWDGQNAPLNPTRGWFLDARLPYIQTRINDVAAQYLKYEATGKLFIPVGPHLTLAGMLHGGGGFSLQGAASLPQTERFRLGGQHFLRGYLDDGIRQYTSDGKLRSLDANKVQCQAPFGAGCASVSGDGNIVVNGSWELRFPIARDNGFWGAAFWDFGGIAEDSWSQLSPASIRHGVGVGVRMLLAGQIPARLDYGFALDRRCRDLAGGVCQAYDEFGRLHLALLYSF